MPFSLASIMIGALALLLASAAASARAAVDTENRYRNVGAIMVWRVDDSGKPVELGEMMQGRSPPLVGILAAAIRS